MSLWKVFMQDLSFFRFLYEQWYKFKIEIVKVGKILGCLKIGSADSPRVRGGRSAIHEAVHQRLCREVVNRRNSLRTVRQRTADNPPKDRGQSASVGQYLPEAVSVGWQCENSKADGPLGYRGQSANGQKGGSWQLNLSWVTKVYP